MMQCGFGYLTILWGPRVGKYDMATMLKVIMGTGNKPSWSMFLEAFYTAGMV
jgi:hypothetical protein